DEEAEVALVVALRLPIALGLVRRDLAVQVDLDLRLAQRRAAAEEDARLDPRRFGDLEGGLHDARIALGDEHRDRRPAALRACGGGLRLLQRGERRDRPRRAE